jgi:hypothetical protein
MIGALEAIAGVCTRAGALFRTKHSKNVNQPKAAGALSA